MVRVLISFFILCACILVMRAEGFTPSPTQFSNIVQNADLTNHHLKQRANNPLSGFKDEDVFLNVGGVDFLKWKFVREQIESEMKAIPIQSGMESGEVESIRGQLFQSQMKKHISAYIRLAVLAAEAKRIGIVIPREAFDRKLAEVRKQQVAGGAKEHLIKMLDAPESFLTHKLWNFLYSQAYVENVIQPTVKVDEAMVNRAITLRKRYNETLVATNAFKCAKIHELARMLRKGGNVADRFARLAEAWSECDSSEDGGVLLDEDGNPRRIGSGDLREEIESVYRQMKPGEISDVVETPYSWHIVKLIRNVPASEGEDAKVELAHIMLEKALLEPELTEEDARRMLMERETERQTRAKFVELAQTTKIDCLIPLIDSQIKGKRSRKIVQRIR